MNTFVIRIKVQQHFKSEDDFASRLNEVTVSAFSEENQRPEEVGVDVVEVLHYIPSIGAAR